MKKAFTDQLARKVEIEWPPRRIVSLVPSQTELLAHLGLEDRLRGITKFCVEPEHIFRSKKRIGGTKNIRIDEIRDLRPDLIIANKEENTKSQIEELARDFPVWISDVNDLPSALQMIEMIGRLTGTAAKAIDLRDDIDAKFARLEGEIRGLQAMPIAYFIWRQPYMVAGADTFINDMLKRAGFHNVFGDRTRYPEVDAFQITESGAEALLLSSEPYPFKESHLKELQAICPGSGAILVDGQLFSWYGSRLLKSPSYFRQLRQSIDKKTGRK
ncbi:MAG: helical backbone metal receptor [Saprospiraceae bacterium]|nr:helical backbone metal receptor [Saprospiraceae bacterium]